MKFMIDASEEFDIKLETPETDLNKLSFGRRQSPSRTESTDPDDDYVYSHMHSKPTTIFSSRYFREEVYCF